MVRTDAVYVIGHKNPDTDAIASAMGYAWLRQNRDEETSIAARAGSINAQTKFALEYFGLQPPFLLEDAAPRFALIAHRVTPVHPARPLSAAWQLHASTERAAPIVDHENHPVGMVTGQSVFEFLSMRLDMLDAPFKELIRVPCGDACDTGAPKFLASDRISDHRGRILRTNREDFWVVNSDGGYEGTCSRVDMLQPPKLKLILTDHNELGQAVNGLNEAELIEVLDHHRLATVSTTLPIAFHIDAVGSCSTLVAERMRLARLTPPEGIAGMLLSGLLSDTLHFKSPTTTARDKASATWLSWIAFGVDGADKKLDEYAAQLLAAGADLSGRSAKDLVSADFKEFEAGKIKFGVAQVEVTNFQSLTERIGEVRKALNELREQRGLEFAALMVTDIVYSNSLLVCVGETRYLERMPFSRKDEGIWDMPGVVSRKKQLLPMLLGILQG
jgi:manganese-dependent inorganic pyrophosphatase